MVAYKKTFPMGTEANFPKIESKDFYESPN